MKGLYIFMFLRKLINDDCWKKIKNSGFYTKPIRVLCEVIPITLANVCLSLVFQDLKRQVLWIIATVALILVYIILVAFYADVDDYVRDETNKLNEKNVELTRRINELKVTLEDKENSIVGYEASLSAIQSSLELSAKNLNILKHDLKADKEAPDTIWSFSQTCAIICKDVFNTLVKMYGHDNSFEVSYIEFSYDDECTYSSRMNYYVNRNNEIPTINNKIISLPRNIKAKTMKKRYCFERILYEKTNAPVILLSEEEIKLNFYFSSNDQRENCKYKQYIGIPVCCDSKKPIGLLQIAIFENNIIKGDKDSINQFLISILRPMSYLSLLANKTQDCISILTGGVNE